MEIVLLWCFVLAWMGKRGAEDLVHAVKGTPNPRYELKKAKAKAAGQQPKQQPRYGGKEWFADLMSDAMVAHTEKRRKSAKAKAQPVDDMIGIVQKPKRHPHDPNDTRRCSTCYGEVVFDGRPCPRCLAEQQRRNAEWEADQRREAEWKDGMHPVGDYEKPTCIRCRVEAAQPGSARCPRCDREEGNYPDTRPDATIIRFPNPKNIKKEITMANSEVTGLSAALAFAAEAASAHNEFATGGSEGYTAALAGFEVGPECIGSAVEAQEASQIAAAKWQAHKEHLEAQLGVKEAYQGNPDAGNKTFLLNG